MACRRSPAGTPTIPGDPVVSTSMVTVELRLICWIMATASAMMVPIDAFDTPSGSGRYVS